MKLLWMKKLRCGRWVNVCGGMIRKNIGISSTCVLVGCMLLCGCVGLGKEDIYNEV